MYSQHQHQKQQFRAARSRSGAGQKEDSSSLRESREGELLRVNNTPAPPPADPIKMIPGSIPANSKPKRKRKSPKKTAAATVTDEASSGHASNSCESGVAAKKQKKTRTPKKSAKEATASAPALGANASGGSDRGLLNALLSPTHFRSSAPATNLAPAARKLEFSPPASPPSPARKAKRLSQSPPDSVHHKHYAGGSFQNAPDAGELPIPDFDDGHELSSVSSPILIGGGGGRAPHDAPIMSPPMPFIGGSPNYVHPAFHSAPSLPGFFPQPQYHNGMVQSQHPIPYADRRPHPSTGAPAMPVPMAGAYHHPHHPHDGMYRSVGSQPMPYHGQPHPMPKPAHGEASRPRDESAELRKLLSIPSVSAC